MKKVIVTGACGFVGYHLVQALLQKGYFVYAVVRPRSQHRKRLKETAQLRIVDLAMQDIIQLPTLIMESCDVFYHLAWEGERNDFVEQNKNIAYTIQALEVASILNCHRFICTGSQAEYGLQNGLTTEETLPMPNTAYGSAKLAAFVMSRFRASQLGIEWIWGRIFSVYGLYDGPNTLVSYLLRSLKNGEIPVLTSAKQKWDYLYATDAARAIIALAEKGHDGEIYNIANGDIHSLRYFVEEICSIVAPTQLINYGQKSRIIVSLMPSVEKIQKHTGWHSEIKFFDGIIDTIDKISFAKK